jgi:hypothetical protein
MKFPRQKAVKEPGALPLAVEQRLRALARGGEEAGSREISRLQELIHDTEPDQGRIGVILWDLAYDLEYVLAEPLFGPEKAAGLAKKALSEIEQLLARET